MPILSLFLSLCFLDSPPKFRCTSVITSAATSALRVAVERHDRHLVDALNSAAFLPLQLPTLFPCPLLSLAIISRRRCYPICCEKEQNYHNFHFLLALLSFSLSPSPNAVALVPRRFPHTRTHTHAHADGAA